MPSEGIVYRSGKRKLTKRKSRVTLAEQIAQNRAHGHSSANYSARSGKSNKTTSDLDSVDISHLTRHDDSRQAPTPLPTLNPRYTAQQGNDKTTGNINSDQRQIKQRENSTGNRNQTMPYQNSNVKHIPPPGRQPGGSNDTRRSSSNHGVTLPPIENNNKVTNGNDGSGYKHAEQSYTRQTEVKDRDYEKQRSTPRSDSMKKNRDKRKYNRSRSNSPSRHSTRSSDKSYKSNRRSRSREGRLKELPRNRHHRADSRNRVEKQRHQSRERGRSKSRESGQRWNSRDNRRRSKSKDRKGRSNSRNSRHRRRSREVHKRSQSRERNQDSTRERRRRETSVDRKRNKSRGRQSYGSKSVERRRRSESDSSISRRASWSRDRKHKIQHRKGSESKSRSKNQRRKSTSRDREGKGYKQKSEGKERRYLSRSSSRDNDSRRLNKSKSYSMHRKSKHSKYDSNDDFSDSDTSTLSFKSRDKRKYKSEVAMISRARDKQTAKMQSKSNKHKSRSSRPESQTKYNIIILKNGEDYSSASEDDKENQDRKTIFVRSKSQHTNRLNVKRRASSRDYHSDIDSRQFQPSNNRTVVYYDNEPEEIIVTPRNRMNIQRTVRHANGISTNQNSQNEELFYLVPAANRMIASHPNGDNALFVNQANGGLVRVSDPAPQNRTNQLHYMNKNDAVYGQEPLYDEYRQPIQQKFYNQHTNHYRHERNMETTRSHDNFSTSTLNQNTIHQSTFGDNFNPNNDIATEHVNHGKHVPIKQNDGRTPDGQSGSSNDGTPSSFVSESRISVQSETEYRASTAERRRALKHLNELSNYNINVVMGKTSARAPPMTDETMLKKLFNAEFQSQMDDYLRS